MKGLAHAGVVNWVEFPDPKNDKTTWNVNLTFLMSNWNCLYGKGCPGHFGVQSENVFPDIGCCTDGFYVRDEEDMEDIKKNIDRLTDADWDTRLRHHVEKTGGWFRKAGSIDGEPEYKSRVFEGGCVFANRSDGSAGKPGCAFLALADRLGKEVDDHAEGGHNTHTSYMPQVCHQLPLKFEDDYDEDTEETISTIDAWDSWKWSEDIPEDNHDSWMAWWCVDAPEAYTGNQPLYVTMEDTLRSEMGAAYDRLLEIIEEQQPRVAPMAAAVQNEGRPLLPLLIGNRTPKRPDPNFDAALKEMAHGSG